MRKQQSLLWLAIVTMALLVFASVAPPVQAQTIQVEWNRWDANITVGTNDSLNIQETQEINVTNGTVRTGRRDWTTPVNVSAVFFMTNSSRTPVTLNNDSSGAAGTYRVSRSGSGSVLQYVLPQPQSQGSVFSVIINYTATSPTTGMVDWIVVPAEHNFVVRSSTVRLVLPSGQTPDPTLVRITNGQGQVSVEGNSVLIRSTQAIQPQEKWVVRVPYGENVGAADGSGDTGGLAPAATLAPAGGNAGTGGLGGVPGGTIIPVDSGSGLICLICLVGALFMFGGSGILKRILGGGLPGMPTGGRTGTGNDPLGGLGGLLGGLGNLPRAGSPRTRSLGDDGTGTSSSTGNRGFRRSADQDRNIGSVGSDKDSGGGASFG